MSVVLPQEKYPTHARRSAFYDELIGRVEALPGVQLGGRHQLDSAGQSGRLHRRQHRGSRPTPPPGQGKRPAVVTRVVSPHYFRTMGIQLLQGREFDERGQGRLAAVVRHQRDDGAPLLARRRPRRQAHHARPTPTTRTTGARSSAWCRTCGSSSWPPSRSRRCTCSYAQAGLLRAAPPRRQHEGGPDGTGGGGAQGRVGDRQRPAGLERRTMEEVLSESLARQRFSMLLLGIFAAVALVLAAVGHLRRDELLGRAAYARDRHPHGARRAARRRAEAGGRAGLEARPRRASCSASSRPSL